MMNVCDLYIKNGSVAFEELKAATETDLHDLLEIVNHDTSCIAAQIGKAKAQVFSDGVYSDPQWYHKAVAAKRFKGQLSQRIQNEITRRKKSKKEQLSTLLQAIDLVLNKNQRRRVLSTWHELQT